MDTPHTRQTTIRANLKYQDAASHLLVTTCPAVSSHLQYEFNESVFKNRINMPVSRRHQVCQSCGSISTPDTSTPLKIESQWRRGKRNPSKARKGQPKDMRSIVTKCKVCGIPSKTWLEPAPRLSNHIQHKESEKSTSAISTNAKKPSRSQRLAQRKKDTSLQAMLTRSKSSQKTDQSSFGLSFMDFMKSDKN